MIRVEQPPPNAVIVTMKEEHSCGGEIVFHGLAYEDQEHTVTLQGVRCTGCPHTFTVEVSNRRGHHEDRC